MIFLPRAVRAVGLTDESRENNMISLAMDVAEQQLREGNASPLIIAHFLRIGSQRAMLERDKIQQETELMKAKKAAIEAEENDAEMYRNAIEAMRTYTRSSDMYDE